MTLAIMLFTMRSTNPRTSTSTSTTPSLPRSERKT